MEGKNISGAGEGGQIDDSWWAALGVKVLHPVQVQIIEAFWCIDQPLSAGDLFVVFEEKVLWTTLTYHVRRLSKLRAIELAERPSAPNPLDVPYKLVQRRKGNET